MIYPTPHPYAQNSHNSQKSPVRVRRTCKKAFTRILRILRFSPFLKVHAGVGWLEASHVSVPRKRLLCEAEKQLILPVVA